MTIQSCSFCVFLDSRMTSEQDALDCMLVCFISAFLFQSGVCHSTVLCVVPSEEVSEMFKLDTEITVTGLSQLLTLVFPLFEYLQSLHDSVPPEKLHNTPTVYVFDPLTSAFLPPQSSSMSVSRLEPELQEKIRANHPGVERVYFNKGL